ncbi:cortactin-binding_protein [Hexamita inflata]|uniref:Cortactin-binding protein n=1 Tax=Hexamita inflata TaxID=28002 RepID=A0AA86NKL0_9EUKA|nr:cortactin-binding protein [Hexamita inflata]
MQQQLHEIVSELEKLQQEEKLRNEQTTILKKKLDETLKLVEQIPADDQDKIQALESELALSDDTRLKIQRKLNEKMSEVDDLQDQVQNLKQKLEQYEKNKFQDVDTLTKEKIADLEQQLVQSDTQRQKLSGALNDKVAIIDDMQDQIDTLKKEIETLKKGK